MVAINSPEYQFLLEHLRQARHDAGLTQVQVAERLGIRQAVVSKIELGERKIDPVELGRFAEIYGNRIGWFLGQIVEQE